VISGEIERLNTEVLDLHSGINITTTTTTTTKKVSYHKQNPHQHSWSTMLNFSSCSLITVQNLVVVSHTVCAQGPRILGNARPLWMERACPP